MGSPYAFKLIKCYHARKEVENFMTALSDYLENELLDHALAVGAFTSPASVFVALFTADDGLEGGTVTSEVSGGSYARQSVTFAAASAGATSNTGAVSFTDMPAVTVSHAAIVDGDVEGAGNVLFHGALGSPVTLSAGSTFTIAAGDLDVSLA